MALPAVYRKGGKEFNVSYDWTDVADGTGIVELYCFAAGESGAFTYHLGKTAIEPGSMENTTPASHNRRFLFASSAVTFDLGEFNTPRIVRGNGMFNFTLATLGAFTGTAIVSAAILKNDTTLATASCSITIAGNIKSYNLQTPITQTNFKRGDNLKVKFWTTSSNLMLEHDPQNRSISSFVVAGGAGTHAALTASENPSKCMVYIPFKI